MKKQNILMNWKKVKKNSKLKLLENKLNEKNKTIDTLEKNIKDFKNKNISLNKYKEELEKKKDDEEYFNIEEENKTEALKKINELNILNNEYKQIT